MGKIHGDCSHGSHSLRVARVISFYPELFCLSFTSIIPALILLHVSASLCLSFTHSLILSFGDRYEWSKVTSCIHNILSGQRWIEHYGEMSIKHSNTMGDVSHCKVTFLKVGPSRHAKFFHSTYGIHSSYIPHMCVYPCLSCPHLPLVEQPRPNSHFMSNLFITSSFIMIFFFFMHALYSVEIWRSEC